MHGLHGGEKADILSDSERPIPDICRFEYYVRKHFPILRAENVVPRSPNGESYNCAAYVLGIFDQKWWPVEQTGYTWPAGARRDDSLEAFLEGYGRFGYEPCENGDFLLHTTTAGADVLRSFEIAIDPRRQ
jgi:hypothetical protein